MRFISFLFTLVWSSSTFAQTPDWTTYGLPGEVIDYLEHENLLWLATDIGLYSVDPDNLETVHYSKSNSGLPSNRIDALNVDGDGRLWIGTYDMSIAILSDDSWEVITIPSGLFPEAAKIYDMEFDAGGKVWIATGFGLTSYDPATDGWTVISGMDAPTATYDLAADGSGALFVAADRLYRYQPGTDSWENLTDMPASGSPSSVYSSGTSSLLLVDDGIWFCSEFGWVSFYNDYTWMDFTTGSACTSGQTPMLRQDGEGKVWLQTDFGGLFILDTTEWISVPFNHPTLEEFLISSLFFDQTGARWVSAPGRLIRGEAGSFEKADLSGLNIEYGISSLKFALDGTPHLIDHNGVKSRVLRFDGNSWIAWDEAPEQTRDIAFAADGSTWFATLNEGLVHLDDSGISSIADTPFGTQLYKVTVSPDGTVWCSDFNGLYHYDGSTWSTYDNTTTGILPADYGIHYVDPLGRIWVRSTTTDLQRHLSLFDGSTWRTWSESDGLPTSTAMSMILEEDGSLLMSNYENGLTRFDLDTETFSSLTPDTYEAPCWSTLWLARDPQNHLIASCYWDGFGVQEEDGSWTKYTEENSPLLSNGIYSVVPDPTDGFWITSGSGTVNTSMGLQHLRWGTSTAINHAPSNAANPIKAYPNPASDRAVISWDQEHVSSTTTIEIFDHSGQMLRSIKLGPIVAGPFSTTISLSDVPHGLLLIRRTDETGAYDLRLLHME